MSEATTPAGSSLARKLSEVMGAVGRIAKRGRNDFHKYDYAMEADIVEAVRGELAQRKIAFVPQIDSYDLKDLPARDGKAKMLSILKLTFSLIDGDTGERLDRPWYGTGEDGSDKGLYKAMTGAEKYFLLKLFLIPTGDDPERDDEPRTGNSRQAARPEPSKPAEKRPTVTIAKVEERKDAAGTTLGYVVTFSDGREGRTKDAGIARQAEVYRDNHNPMDPILEPNQRDKNKLMLIELGAIDQPF